MKVVRTGMGSECNKTYIGGTKRCFAVFDTNLKKFAGFVQRNLRIFGPQLQKIFLLKYTGHPITSHPEGKHSCEDEERIMERGGRRRIHVVKMQ